MLRQRLFTPTPGLPNRAMLLERLSRHTRFVQLCKLLLVLAIIALLGTVVLLPVLRGDTTGVRIALTKTDQGIDATPIMKNPRFQGTDDEMQPYMVTADSAIQQDADTIILSHVQGDMTFKDATWMTVSADQGTLTLSRETLDLTGQVNLFHDGGYEMRTEQISVNMTAGTAHSETPLEGQATMGYIKAHKFSAFDRGQRLLFHGPVTLVIFGERDE